MTVHVHPILIIPEVSSNIMPYRQNVQLQKSTHSILPSINPKSSLGLRTAKILLFAMLAKRLNSQNNPVKRRKRKKALLTLKPLRFFLARSFS
jgi:hypothetical protein